MVTEALSVKQASVGLVFAVSNSETYESFHVQNNSALPSPQGKYLLPGIIAAAVVGRAAWVRTWSPPFIPNRAAGIAITTHRAMAKVFIWRVDPILVTIFVAIGGVLGHAVLPVLNFVAPA